MENEQFLICNEKFKTIFNRLDKIEVMSNNIHDLSISVNKLAHNIETILAVNKEQNKRIKAIEDEEVDKYRNIRNNIIMLIIGGIIGFLFKYLKLQ